MVNPALMRSRSNLLHTPGKLLQLLFRQLTESKIRNQVDWFGSGLVLFELLRKFFIA